MSVAARMVFPWLLPLLVCGVVGAAALLELHRALTPEGEQAPLPVGVGAFVPLATLFGLRLITLLLQVLGKVGIGFRFSLWVVLLLAVVAAVRLGSAIRRNRAGQRKNGLEGAMVRDSALLGLDATAIAFCLLLLSCALFSYVGGWDVFTHWLVVPNEILSFNRMAYAYGTTRSVAASYPVHQVGLGAVACLLSGGRDAIANVFSSIFLLFASLAILEASWVVARSALLAGLALLIVLAVAGTPEVVFGYFYGDALVLAGLAFSLLGIAYHADQRGRASLVVVWACLTMPLMTKGFGLYLAVIGGAFLACSRLLPLGGGAGARRSEWKPILILSAIFILEIALPRLFLIGVRSSEIPIPNARMNPHLSLWPSVVSAVTTTKDNYLFLAMLILSVAVPLHFVVRGRKAGATSHSRAVWLYALYGMLIWGLLVAVTVYYPESKISWPRYATMTGPVGAMLVVVGLRSLQRSRWLVTLPFLAIAMLVFVRSDYRGYIVAYSNWSMDSIKDFPRKSDPIGVDKVVFDSIRRNVESVGGRIFYLDPGGNPLAAYQLSYRFAIEGIRAPLLSRAATAPMEQIPLVNQVEGWVFVNRLDGPIPPQLHVITDFFFFPKAFVLKGRSFVGLVRLMDLLAIR